MKALASPKYRKNFVLVYELLDEMVDFGRHLRTSVVQSAANSSTDDTGNFDVEVTGNSASAGAVRCWCVLLAQAIRRRRTLST